MFSACYSRPMIQMAFQKYHADLVAHCWGLCVDHFQNVAITVRLKFQFTRNSVEHVLSARPAILKKQIRTRYDLHEVRWEDKLLRGSWALSLEKGRDGTSVGGGEVIHGGLSAMRGV